MRNLDKILFYMALLFSTMFLQSCVKDDNYSVPPIDCTGLKTNMSFSDLITKVDASQIQNNLVFFAEDAVIEGYVNSSDQTGNFYKTFSIQESLSNPTLKGIQIEIDQTNLYTKYPEGAKVQIQLKGLVAGYDRGVLKIGSPYVIGTEQRVGRMSDLIATSNVKKTCESLGTVIPREYNSISEALKLENVNTLITINNVQFEDPFTDKTYGDKASGVTVNRKLIDIKGRTVDLRNSAYAAWANEDLPTTSGKITVVVSIYNGTYQLYIRDLNDVNFNQERFEAGEAAPPSKITFSPFKGADFNNWTDFIESAGFNTQGQPFSYSSIIVQKVGLGMDASDALGIDGTVTANGTVFVVRPTSDDLIENPSKINFWIKGSSAKSLNIYVYKTNGTHYTFNVGALTDNKIITVTGTSNSYTGQIDTGNEWKLIELSLGGLSDINLTDANKNFLEFRLGNNAVYNLLIDDITIE